MVRPDWLNKITDQLPPGLGCLWFLLWGKSSLNREVENPNSRVGVLLSERPSKANIHYSAVILMVQYLSTSFEMVYQGTIKVCLKQLCALMNACVKGVQHGLQQKVEWPNSRVSKLKPVSRSSTKPRLIGTALTSSRRGQGSTCVQHLSQDSWRPES